MTTETQRRIRAYKRALPELRERVVAVALLLAMSASMLTSASFAWLTLSRNPEIKGMNSTVAANGNLEIALATGDGKDAPVESEVGDSSATQGQTVKAANITWGNLVNLADSSYGLENLILRPAQLNTDALLDSPLSAASYTKDGRVEKLTTSFKYTSWIIPEKEGEVPYFGLAEGLGVRAVSSTAISANSFAGKVENMILDVEGMNNTARSNFMEITQNQTWMKSLGSMMSTHMNATLNTEEQYVNATVSMTEIQNLVDMYAAFESAFDSELNAMTELVNLELYLAYGGDDTKYVEKTKDDILNAISNPKKDGARDYIAATVTADNGAEKVVKITALETFLYDYNLVKTDRLVLEGIRDGGVYKWKDSGLKDVISRLVDLNTCEIQVGKDAPMTIKAFLAQFNGAGFSELLSLNSKYNGKDCNAIITNGVLYNFEKRVGSKIVVKDTSKNKGLELKASIYSTSINYEATATVYATISTSAEEPYQFVADLQHAKSLNTGAGLGVGDVTAMDTYGLVIDLWARTNASNSYLMLEGNVLTKKVERVVQKRDAEGNLVDVYVLIRNKKVEYEDGTSQTYTDTYDLYQKTSGSTVTWYNANTYAVFELMENEEPTKKMEIIHEVIGYEGENRVWTEEVSPLLTTDATTQGSGSCYVFYADNPQDQTQSLELLKAMRVAFIDDKGDLLATAKMDSTKAYEEAGRVTVPLVMDTHGVILGQDDNGDPIHAITPLEANVPFRITALVYLDGSIIANEHVLAASNIQGQLNIQFGSSANLMAVNDTELEGDIRRVSASIDNTYFDFDTATGDMVTNVTLNVEGSQPTTITANFIRKINASQGTREETMVFESVGNGTWKSSYEFLTPGNYELRTIRLDGVDYDLSGDLPQVTVEGFALSYLVCQQGKNVYHMTAKSSYPLDLSLKFATNDLTKMPKSVVGYYVRTDGYQTNVNFTMNSNTQEWTGKANFLMSGEYTLKFLELDGGYYNLNETDYQMATVYLGMQAAVWSTSPQDPDSIIIDNSTSEEDKVLKLQVKLLDNTGGEMMGEDNVKIVYRQRNGSREMDGDLTWNALTGFYEGTIPINYYGRFQFSKLVVRGDDITVASRAPSFTILSPDPTEYVGFSRQGAVYAPDGDASLHIRLSNAVDAYIVALIVDENGNEYTVECGSENAKELQDQEGVYQYNIPVPLNSSDSQDGTWTLVEARVSNVFGENGHEYTADAPLVIDLRDQDNTVKVTHKIRTTFAANQGADFSGAFLQGHDIKNVSVTIDAAGHAVDVNGDGKSDISNVKIVYGYGGDAAAKGGYTGTNIAATDKAFTLTLTSTDGMNFKQDGIKTINIAGTYTPREFSFDVFDGTRTTTKTFKVGTNDWPQNVPAYTITSATPTVAISGRSEYGSSTNTATSATVYSNYRKEAKEDGCDKFDAYDQPYVDITLTGYGYASSASLVFATADGSEVRLYETNGASSSVNSFTWTSATACKRYVGWYQKTSNSQPDVFSVATTMTASVLTFTDSTGNTYTVTLTTPIEIKNPS